MTGDQPTIQHVSGRAIPLPPERAALMRAATYASVTVAMTLIVAKFWALLVTGSVAILASLVDSGLDVAASLLNLVAVHHALTPADREHRFGHGKAEAVAGLGQAAVIAGSAVFVLSEAGKRFIHPQPLENSAAGLAVMGFSLLMTLALLVFQRYVVSKTKSVAIAADSLHYLTDLLTAGAVIVALLLTDRLGWKLADPVFALAISGYIIWSAWRITRTSFDQIMDRELPDPDRLRIRDIVLSHPEVRDMHDLRTRMSGTNSFIQLHLELDGQISLTRAHLIADEVELNVKQAFPGAEVLIHQDPEGLEQPPVFE